MSTIEQEPRESNNQELETYKNLDPNSIGAIALRQVWHARQARVELDFPHLCNN